MRDDERKRKLDSMQRKAFDEDLNLLPIDGDKWPLQPFQRAVFLEETIPPVLAEYFAMHPKEKAEALVNRENTFVNDTYQVLVSAVEDSEPALLHLSIRRIDNEPIHDWRDLQSIKNMLIGTENEGFELYPAESRKQDSCNKYHLYVLKDAAQRFDVGAFYRAVTNKTPVGKQRPFKGF